MEFVVEAYWRVIEGEEIVFYKGKDFKKALEIVGDKVEKDTPVILSTLSFDGRKVQIGRFLIWELKEGK